jgi:hypothetical protein
LQAVIGTVHEDVLLDGVAVKVNVKAKSFLVNFLKVLCQPQQVEDLRKGVLSGLVESAV